MLITPKRFNIYNFVITVIVVTFVISNREAQQEFRGQS